MIIFLNPDDISPGGAAFGSISLIILALTVCYFLYSDYRDKHPKNTHPIELNENTCSGYVNFNDFSLCMEKHKRKD